MGGGGIDIFDNFLFKFFAYVGITSLFGIFFPAGVYKSFGWDFGGILTWVLVLCHLGGALMLAAYTITELSKGSLLKGLIGPALIIALLYGSCTSASWFPILQVASSVIISFLSLPCGVILGVIGGIAELIISHVMDPGDYADNQGIGLFVALIPGIIFSLHVVKDRLFSPFYPTNWIHKLWKS